MKLSPDLLVLREPVSVYRTLIHHNFPPIVALLIKLDVPGVAYFLSTKFSNTTGPENEGFSVTDSHTFSLLCVYVSGFFKSFSDLQKPSQSVSLKTLFNIDRGHI